jgi:chorismate dehydratase
MNESTPPRPPAEPYRVGSVPYLNARPLVAPLAERADVRLTLLPPRELSSALADGRSEVALIPTFEFLRRADYRAVPGIAIASRGPVRSVLFFHRVPIREVRRVAVDRSSLSSAALLRVILRGVHGLEPEYADAPPDLRALELGADGALLIGDAAMRAAAASGVARIDLGEAWTRLTGLPFVYAVFAMRPTARERDLVELLHSAKREGLRRRDEIAAAAAGELGLAEEVLLDYLRKAIRYGLGPSEIAGMEAFRDALRRLGLLEGRKAIVLLEPAVRTE